MAKDDANSKIHIIPKWEWDGKFPVHCKTLSQLEQIYEKSNRRKRDDNITKHHRRTTDPHIVPKLKQPFFLSSDVTE
jgi:hypothetical protein